MKIIDLLNKIANGETLPKRIKYDRFNYIFDDNCDNYVRIDDEDTSLNWNFIVLNSLNSEVEIIEKPKKIEKLFSELILGKNYFDEEKKNINYELKIDMKGIADKINEIIEVLNER